MEKEEWVGSHLAASIWMYTKAALCDGRKKDPPLDLQPILATIIESVSWVTEDSLLDHEWITETKVTMRENPILEARHYDIEVPRRGWAGFTTKRLMLTEPNKVLNSADRCSTRASQCEA